jgi:serine/threonine protein kinase
MGFLLPSIRTVLTQLLEALGVLENRGVVHADIKPENIVLSLRRFGPILNMSQYMTVLNQLAALFQGGECGGPKLEVILIDWSSASIGYSQKAPYVQSRFYRAPEVILRQKYGPSVDIWSLACVVAELFLGSPLFPGSDEIEMLRLIQLKLGILPTMMIKRMGEDSPARVSDEWRLEASMYLPGNFELSLRERWGNNDLDFLAFINILRLMLQLNCDARITPSFACDHPFVTGVIDPGAQPLSRQKRDSLMNESASGTSTSGKKKRIVRRTSKEARERTSVSSATEE